MRSRSHAIVRQQPASELDGNVLRNVGRWLARELIKDRQGADRSDVLLLDWLRGCSSAQRAIDVEDSGELEAYDAVLDLDRAVESAAAATRRAIRT